MVKHTQTICSLSLLLTNYLSVFDHFVGLALRGLSFSNKLVAINILTLRDGDKIISDSEKITYTCNKIFVNTENTLKIDKDKRFLVEPNDVFDPVLKAIKKYSAHPSILSIKEKKR